MQQTIKEATLLLADGTLFKGKSFGMIGTSGGEICFNTGMTGYQEVFTDPSYYGQVLIMNNAHIGNYGINELDIESSSVKINALIGRNLEEHYSRSLAKGSLSQYLIDNKIVAIEGVDTRYIVAHVRNKGAMNCIISSEIEDLAELQKELEKIPNMEGLELASSISTIQEYELGDAQSKIKIAVLDFGIKKHILKCMTDRGAHVKVFPAKTSFQKIDEFNPGGYFISNGPGDPSSMHYAIGTIKEILQKNKPVFGICLGHQLLALANDVDTFKMHHGHRGLNHPVKNVLTGKCEITTQNHGFGVSPDSIKNNDAIEITHINLNDSSIEGIRVKNTKAFSVQYHPEATPGPHDSRYLFDDFIEMIHSN